jgi:hypothetical protein
MPYRRILLTSFLQLPKKTCLLILLLHRGELQGERLAVLMVKFQPSRPSPCNSRDDGPMIRIVESGLPKHHVAEELFVPALSHAIVWLGLMPLSPPLLLPSPSHPLSLSLTQLLDVFA